VLGSPILPRGRRGKSSSEESVWFDFNDGDRACGHYHVVHIHVGFYENVIFHETHDIVVRAIEGEHTPPACASSWHVER